MSTEGTNESGLTEIVSKEVNDQIEIEALLGDQTLREQLDGEKLGAAVGRELGARVGRTVGERIGQQVHETVSSGREEGKQPAEIATDIRGAVQSAIVSSLREADIDGPMLASLLGAESDSDGDGGLSELLGGESTEGDEDEDDDEEEAKTVEGSEAESERSEPDGEESAVEEEAVEDQETKDQDEGETEADEVDQSLEDTTVDVEEAAAETDEMEATAENLEELRTETLEDFLEVMSYRDLQSVAKEVGVKANLSREEMTRRIVAQVTDDEAADGEGEQAQNQEQDQDKKAESKQ